MIDFVLEELLKQINAEEYSSNHVFFISRWVVSAFSAFDEEILTILTRTLKIGRAHAGSLLRLSDASCPYKVIYWVSQPRPLC